MIDIINLQSFSLLHQIFITVMLDGLFSGNYTRQFWRNQKILCCCRSHCSTEANLHFLGMINKQGHQLLLASQCEDTAMMSSN